MLTVSFEILFGLFVVGLTLPQIWNDYDLLSGGLMPLRLVFLFFSPLLAAKLGEKRLRINGQPI